MSKRMITVISALYGTPGKVIDVTAKIQDIFDQQYEINNSNNTSNLAYTVDIGYTKFDIPDPDPGVVKACTIVYNLPLVGSDCVFMRGGQDNVTLTLTAGPARTIQVKQAIYATYDMGLDVTEKLNAYLRDPGNSTTLVIGSPTFESALTEGQDFEPGRMKCFSVSYTTSSNQNTQHLCGYVDQTVNIS